MSLGRSRSLNALVSRHGSLSGSAWLHYDEDSRDVVFCHPCVTALSRNKVKWSKGESAFVSRGYSNWKDAIMVYKKHEGSDCHKSSIEAIVTLPLQCKDIGEQLSNQVASEKRDNRQCLLKVLSNLRYLARQGIAIRGDGDESNSNFMQLLRLRQNEDPRIKDWIDKKTNCIP